MGVGVVHKREDIDCENAPVAPMSGSDSYTGPDTASVHFQIGVDAPDQPPPLTLVWLPGYGQKADNEILRRLVNSLHMAVLKSHGNVDRISALRVVGLSRIKHLPFFLSSLSSDNRVVLGGHSAGGAAVVTYCSKRNKTAHSAVIGLLTWNAAIPTFKTSLTSRAAATTVPSMLVIGENDPTASSLKASASKKFAARINMQGSTITFDCDDSGISGGSGRTVKSVVLLAENGDHSMRYNRDPSSEAKNAAATSQQTQAMNLSVAIEMVSFLTNLSEMGGIR